MTWVLSLVVLLIYPLILFKIPQSTEVVAAQVESFDGLQRLGRTLALAFIGSLVIQAYASTLLSSFCIHGTDSIFARRIAQQQFVPYYWPFFLGIYFWGWMLSFILAVFWEFHDQPQGGGTGDPDQLYNTALTLFEFLFLWVMALAVGSLIIFGFFKIEVSIAFRLRLGVDIVRNVAKAQRIFVIPAIFAFLASLQVFDAFWNPDRLSASMGPLFIVVSTIITVCVIASAVQLLVDGTELPLVEAFTVIIVAVGLVSASNPNYRITANTIKEPSALISSKKSSVTDARIWNGRFIIAAQGGGMYAAYHSALTLAIIEDSCPGFADSVELVSAVSGGAVGVSVFAATQELINETGMRRVKTGKCYQRSTETKFSHQDVVEAFFHDVDFLSPVMASLIYWDFPRSFWGFQNLSSAKAAQFEKSNWPQSRANALENALSARWKSVSERFGGSSTNQEFFERALTDAKVGRGPIVYNATITETGWPLLISASSLLGGADSTEKAREWSEIFPDKAITIKVATILSARFPFVTPPGSMPSDGKSSLRIVDGGYFDNSGTYAVSAYLRALRRADDLVPTGVPLLVLAFNNSEIHSYQWEGGDDLGAVALSFLNARSAIGVQFLRDLRSSLSVDEFLPLELADKDFNPALGWLLSRRTMAKIEDRANRGARKVAKALDALFLQGRVEGSNYKELGNNP